MAIEDWRDWEYEDFPTDFDRAIDGAPKASLWDKGWQDASRWAVVGGNANGGGILTVHKDRTHAEENARYFNSLPGWEAKVIGMKEALG